MENRNELKSKVLNRDRRIKNIVVYADEIALQIKGNPRSHTARTWKWGDGPDFTMEISGHRRGEWRDHVNGQGGQLLTLIKHNLPTDSDEAAICWAERVIDHFKADDKERSLGDGLRDRLLYAREHWDRGKPYIPDDPKCEAVRRYFEKRGLPSVPENLVRVRRDPVRFEKENEDCEIEHKAKAFTRAMLIFSDLNGIFQGYHSINIDPDTCWKIDPQQFPTLPEKNHAGPISGMSVKLGDWRGSDTVVVAEGVETGLSIWQSTGLPVFVAGGISQIAKLELPLGRRIIIAADDDKPGSDAYGQIERAALVLKENGFELGFVRPKRGDGDFNDILVQYGQSRVAEYFHDIPDYDPTEPYFPGPDLTREEGLEKLVSKINQFVFG